MSTSLLLHVKLNLIISLDTGENRRITDVNNVDLTSM